MILAKPSGITLEEHVSNVINEAQYLIDAFPNVVVKYAQLTEGKNFSKWLLASAKYHDDGKKHAQWQLACQQDYRTFIDWQDQNHGNSFKDFEQKKPELAGKNLRNAGIRHEIASICLHKEHNFALPVMIAIAAHHGKLSLKHIKRWTEDTHLKDISREFWIKFRRLSNEDLDASIASFYQFRKFAYRYAEYAGIRSWLMIADQRASGKEAGDTMPDLRPFEYRFPHAHLRNVQKIVQENWHDNFLLVRAPTGSGKTDAALLWSQKQIENGKASRLIIAMPTRFTSNALSINVIESLSETGLYHSSAWFSKYQNAINDGKIEMRIAQSEHAFARKLLTPVTVCTIDHLLMAITLTREDHHQILFNLMNSCLVIDEADFYDSFTQANILVLLELLNEWKVPVMLMSASLPESSKAFYERSGFKIGKIHEDRSDLNRKRCRIESIVRVENIERLEDILNALIVNGSGIIYANTVARAMDYYEWFRTRNVTPILYHSRFIEDDKKKKEEQLLSALGKTGQGKGIAILTQIGEMSVNISSDIMISDICPIDRLVQRVGRLCRFNFSNIGTLHVIIPEKNGILYPAPYGTYDHQNWTPNRALVETILCLKSGESYSAGDFNALINSIYPDETVFEIKAQKNANTLKEYFVQNWLISSVELSQENDESTNHWKSRDIDSNIDVFVKLPERLIYNSWSSFQNVQNQLTISVPSYLVKQGLEKSLALDKKRIIIDDVNFEIVYVRNPLAYSFEIGLDLKVGYDQFL